MTQTDDQLPEVSSSNNSCNASRVCSFQL